MPDVRATIIDRSGTDSWFGPTNRLPLSFVGRIDDPALLAIVSVRIGDGSGGWHLKEMRVRSRDPIHNLTWKEVRAVKLRRAINLTLTEALIHAERNAAGDLVRTAETDPTAIRLGIERYWRELVSGKTGRPFTTPEDRARIIQLYEELKDEKDWATTVDSLVGASRTTVYRIVREHRGKGT